MNKLIAQAKAKLRANHLRWTKQREMMVKVVGADSQHYQDITVVDQAIRQAYPGLSHDTIYRNLKEFERLGLVELRQHHDQMQVKYRCDTAHHHHFICERCGVTQVVEYCPVEKWQNELGDVKLNNHKVELYGYCEKCA